MATTQPAAQAPGHGVGLIAAPLIVLGGGEHARVVIEAARTQGDRWAVQGYVAPEADAGNRTATPAIDLPWLGDDAALARRLDDAAPDDRPWLVLGFGGGETPVASRRVRQPRSGSARPPAGRPWSMPRPGSPRAPRWNRAPSILAHAIVNTGARVGRHAIVNSAAVVEHDVVVGHGSHVAPGAVIGGATRIGEDAFIGLGARVRDHIEIGAGAIVGMGAVVVESIEPGATVVGIPARRHEPGP